MADETIGGRPATITKEGYRLMAIDEGKTIQGGAGFSGGLNAYYYFQKMEYVK